MKSRQQVEDLIAHMESGKCEPHSPESLAEGIKLLKWVLGPEYPPKLSNSVLYAWMGEDELGSGIVGIKRGLVPAGDIPLVATTFAKMVKLSPQMDQQALSWGKKIYLCHFLFSQVVLQTEGGEPLETEAHVNG